jgi:N-acetylneuraminate synthase
MSKINLIAEIGINHNGDLDICRRMLDLAVISGFDYAKLQKRTPELCVPEEKKAERKKTPWGEMSYLEYKKRLEFDADDYDHLIEYCGDRIRLFASVWDPISAEFMAKYTGIVKIPSALITDLSLLKCCRELYHTVIMSTGMSTEEEIEQAVEAARPDVIMHTNSSYPAAYDELNLSYISWLQAKYPGREIGYSGHEYGLTTTFAAAALGATWIERHITLDHDMWGSDQSSSIDSVGSIKLVKGIRTIERALGAPAPRVVLASEQAKLADLRK